MSMTKRYLESLPEDEQNAILGEVDADYEAWWAARESMEVDRDWAEALATETAGDEMC
jgi:hypothetical protein